MDSWKNHMCLKPFLGQSVLSICSWWTALRTKSGREKAFGLWKTNTKVVTADQTIAPANLPRIAFSASLASFIRQRIRYGQPIRHGHCMTLRKNVAVWAGISPKIIFSTASSRAWHCVKYTFFKSTSNHCMLLQSLKQSTITQKIIRNWIWLTLPTPTILDQ